MMFPKPEPRKRMKARKQRQQAKADRQVYAAVTARDGGCCRVCGSRVNVHRHHLKPRSLGGETTESNLVLLCGACHRNAHERRDDGRWMKGATA